MSEQAMTDRDQAIERATVGANRRVDEWHHIDGISPSVLVRIGLEESGLLERIAELEGILIDIRNETTSCYEPQWESPNRVIGHIHQLLDQRAREALEGKG